jgi:formyl-CoA transferase
MKSDWSLDGIKVVHTAWAALCKAMERQDLEHDVKFESRILRTKNRAMLFNLLKGVFAGETFSEWADSLNALDLHWYPVQTIPNVVNDPQARANGSFIPVNHLINGHMEVIANPIKFSKTREKIRILALIPGEHTDEILSELGYSKENFAVFRPHAL